MKKPAILKRFHWGMPLLLSVLIGSFAVFSLMGFLVTRVTKNLPKIIRVEDYHPKIISRIFARHHNTQTELAQYFKEKRILIPYEKIPKHVIEAFLAAEDDKFFEHPGINWVSIMRAVGANLRAGHVVQGGSTITQQVTKSLLLTPERSLDRKLKEVFLAYALERNLKKTQILYLYLNQIYLGHGAWGIEAAAQTYFRKSTTELSIEEAALLAGMPQAPGKYSPFQNAKRAKERQLYVLRRMAENKNITTEMQKKAGATPLAIFRDKPHRIAPDWTEHLRRFALEHYGEKALYEEGLTLTIDANPHLARYGHDALRTGLLNLDKRMGYRGPQKTLRDPREMEKWVSNARNKLLEYHLDAVLLTPDGVMSTDAAIRALGKHHLADLLDDREIYPALVTSVERDRAKIDLGGIHGELRSEDTTWARPVKDDSLLKRPRWKSTKPGDLFQRGDIVMVRPHKTPTGHHFTLDQVPEVEGALISFDLKTGACLSMAGGFDFTRSEFNRALQAMRQPGSAFKPIIYAAALEKGFTPASIIVDSPIVFKDASQAFAWKPNNYEEKFYGDTTFRQALIKSRNVPTIKIVQSIQVPFLIDYTKRLGVAGTFPHDLSLALGSGSMSVIELVKAFALFPRLGQKLIPKWYDTITARDGRVLEQLKVKRSAPEPLETPLQLSDYPKPDDPNQVLDPRVAYIITHLMKEVVQFGTGRDAAQLGRPAAGKTGTTNESMDAWFVGFTPEIITGVWIGYDGTRTLGLGETGAKAALPIWLDFMKEATKGTPITDFEAPEGISYVPIDPKNGRLVRPSHPGAILEAFIQGTEPKDLRDPKHRDKKIRHELLREDRE